MPSDSYTLTISDIGIPATHAATHTLGSTDVISINASQVTAGTLPVARGGTGVTASSTGSGGVVLSSGPTLVAPILGTPAAGSILTNCTGLPISGLVASTSLALGVGTIELGHATDTTISRVSAGRIAVEGVNVVTVSSTDTLTNKTLTSPTLTTPALGVATATSLAATGAITSSGTAGIGYATGAGGLETQITSKSTGVTLHKTCGKITMNNATLNHDTIVTFRLTNTTIAAGDVLILNHINGGTAGVYLLNAQCGAGFADIQVKNTHITAGGGSVNNLSEAIVIAFVVIKAVTA
jgi:hypothetical protein